MDNKSDERKGNWPISLVLVNISEKLRISNEIKEVLIDIPIGLKKHGLV